jgi:hypothetical protein
MGNKSTYKELVDKTNAHNCIPGIDSDEDLKLPSERYQPRPLIAHRTTSTRFFDVDTAPLGTHGSYVTRLSINDTEYSSHLQRQR